MTFDAPIIADEARDIELDFRFIHARHQRGDITVMLTWDWGGDGNPEPVMLLAPTSWDPVANGEPTICVIRLSEGWKWSRTHNSDRYMIGYPGFGKPPASDAWQATTAAYYAMLLGMEAGGMQTVNRIRGIIEDYLGDLAALPPAPQRPDQGSAIARVLEADGTITEYTVTGQ